MNESIQFNNNITCFSPISADASGIASRTATLVRKYVSYSSFKLLSSRETPDTYIKITIKIEIIFRFNINDVKFMNTVGGN